MWKGKGIVWWVVIGWWWVPIYYICIAWWLEPIQKLIRKRKFEKRKIELLKVPIPSFVVKSWGSDLEVISAWQAARARNQWIGATFKEKPLYQYSWSKATVQLVPEPNNPYDGKAIMVLLDGQKIGYVPRPINETYYEALLVKSDLPVEIHGGNRKYIDSTGDLVLEKRDPIVEVKPY